MIAAILPAGTVAVDTFTDAPGTFLFPEEESIVRGAVDKRRREFATGRWCARQAMVRLGRAPTPVLPGPRGEPRWPAGLIGSITHCDGYRAAVLANSDVITTIGIDAEPNAPLFDDVLPAVSLPQERDRIELLRRTHPDVCWDRLLFSAKETVYKAWFPLTARWLDFEDADVTFDPLAGTFDARILAVGAQLHGRRLTGFKGRWLARQGLVVTAIAVASPHRPPGVPHLRPPWQKVAPTECDLPAATGPAAQTLAE
ncbi:4'-phosphopantetheinyl transferase superfamily protein [Micromonospora sp. HNM0581]|uniref:4'-phosphopantetheinyl transferase family protein n=1 Tax=Micromonospora sp. HNM0581 TaxID=2716341 RepID=UPI00146F2B0A|nr:4'-phosphopantetheinyl transferase superfamily protein [Micromonospora sp. HNM0581]NLU78459.1 4'-phosphopantetheinyl transferase superfamily protein [Micromonospora sp. HNM0581]